MTPDHDQAALDAAMRDPDAPPAALSRVEPPSDPWLLRRQHAFGASEVPAVLVALGRRAPETATDKMRKNAKRIKTRAGLFPRIVLEKAGARLPLKHAGGGDRERELVQAWARTMGDDGAIDPSSVWHRDDLPKWLADCWPMVDRHCHRLAVTLDAGCHDVVGERGVVEAKCGDFAGAPHFLHERGLPWFLATQAQAQIAATDAAFGVVVIGEGWAYRDGRISAWPVERDERAIAEIREACAEAWRLVETVQANMEAA